MNLELVLNGAFNDELVTFLDIVHPLKLQHEEKVTQLRMAELQVCKAGCLLLVSFDASA